MSEQPISPRRDRREDIGKFPCRRCGCLRSRVLNGRYAHDIQSDHVYRRRRECIICRYRFNTIEAVE